MKTRRLLDIIRAHVSVVLSDIYKIRKHEITKMPYKDIDKSGKKVSKWLVSVECFHSENENVMAVLSFILTDVEASAILEKGTTAHLFRTGRYEHDR